MTTGQFLTDAAPWLCLTWGLGIVVVTLINAHAIRHDPAVQITASMMPWIIVIVAMSCVAWPALFIHAVLDTMISKSRR